MNELRIIGGEFRSRRLKSVPGLQVRPTPDRLRESLFSVLMPQIDGVVFLDAYAGSGSVGLEALSRGARKVILIEKHMDASRVLRENVEALGVQDRATVLRGSAATLIPQQACDIAFVDPPYEKGAEYEGALSALAATQCRLVIAQHAFKSVLADSYGALSKARILRQGDNVLTFFERST